MLLLASPPSVLLSLPLLDRVELLLLLLGVPASEVEARRKLLLGLALRRRLGGASSLEWLLAACTCSAKAVVGSTVGTAVEDSGALFSVGLIVVGSGAGVGLAACVLGLGAATANLLAAWPGSTFGSPHIPQNLY